jgi:hypothetical protein
MIYTLFIDIYELTNYLESFEGKKIIIFPNFKYYEKTLLLRKKYKVIYGQKIIETIGKNIKTISDIIIYDGICDTIEYKYMLKYLNYILKNHIIQLHFCGKINNYSFLKKIFDNQEIVWIKERDKLEELPKIINMGYWIQTNKIIQNHLNDKILIYSYSTQTCKNIKKHLLLYYEKSRIFIINHNMNKEELYKIKKIITNPFEKFILICTNYIDFGFDLNFIDIVIDNCSILKYINNEIYVNAITLSLLEYRLYKFPNLKIYYRNLDDNQYSSLLYYDYKIDHDDSLLVKINKYCPLNNILDISSYSNINLLNYIIDKKLYRLKSDLKPKQIISLHHIINTNERDEYFKILKIIAISIIECYENNNINYKKSKYKTDKKILNHFKNKDILTLIISIYLTLKYNINNIYIINEFDLNKEFFDKVNTIINNTCKKHFKFEQNWDIILEMNLFKFCHVRNFNIYYKIYTISLLSKAIISEFLFKNIFYKVGINLNVSYNFLTNNENSLLKNDNFTKFHTYLYSIINTDNYKYMYLNLNSNTKICNLFIFLYHLNLDIIKDLKCHITVFEETKIIKKKWKNIFKKTLYTIKNVIAYKPFNDGMLELIYNWQRLIDLRNNKLLH